MSATPATIPTASQRAKVLIPRVNEIPWEPFVLGGQILNGPVIKKLSEGTGGTFSSDGAYPIATWLTHTTPNFSNPPLSHHPCVEEAFYLGGTSQLIDRIYKEDVYLYRPPGVMHGTRPGARYGPIGDAEMWMRPVTFIWRFGTADDSFRFYDGDEHPKVDSQPVTDEHRHWPVRWVECVDTNDMAWHPVADGPWAGTMHKWLSRNSLSGGGTALIDIPAGWAGTGTVGHGATEEFVVAGRLSMGGQWFDTWGYACRPAGDGAGDYASPGGCRLVCFWDVDELAA